VSRGIDEGTKVGFSPIRRWPIFTFAIVFSTTTFMSTNLHQTCMLKTN